MSQLTGILPIIATPFTADGQLDEASLDKLVRHLGAIGCHGVTGFGIASEFYKLSDAERVTSAEIIIAAARASSVPSILSVTDHATVTAVATAKRWQAMGADALMLLPPYFLKPGAAAIAAHIRAVAAAVDIPVVLQYAPEQTGVAIAPEVFIDIVKDHPNAAWLKVECKPPGSYINRLMDLADGGLTVHVGNAGLNMVECHQRGARGVMPGCSLSELYLQSWNCLEAGNRTGATDIHDRLVSVLNHIRQNVEMIIAFEKHILMRRGVIPCDHCRAPSFQADGIDKELFEHLYARIEPLFHAAGASA
ncbi:MAG: dihydrodipicolinate synthase family protein [Planctomycetota bacterium]|jgi:2-keto-3-deoxy-L-arabinonate dehydratase|nr:dihydrodipicolinate synthase family protein [Planctomycetota bacterium]